MEKKNPFHAVPVVSISPLEVFPPVFFPCPPVRSRQKQQILSRSALGALKCGWMVSWAPQVIYV